MRTPSGGGDMVKAMAVRRSGRLTAQQAAVLGFVVDHFGGRQAFPTLREVSAHFGWSGPSAAMCHLKALVAKGVLEADRHADGRLNLGAYRVPGLADAVRAAADGYLTALAEQGVGR